jgi:hypothetical protein
VTDDLARDWRPCNNYGNDRRALDRSGLAVEQDKPLSAEDCQRIAELYAQLYIAKYSTLNPVFTPAFISLTQRTGMMDYRVARAASGRIMAVAGMLTQNGAMTPSVVGYDTSRPKSEALYRIATFLFCDWAMQRGLRLHGSAGAGHFKRQRGAHGIIEYVAVHAGHLGRTREAAIRTLGWALERFVVPMMQREGW